jgi:transcriptional regulator with XRE-family HTH domain
MSKQKTSRTSGGIRLRALRDAYGKTQLDVELDADLGIGYLQRLELGKVQHPKRDTLERLLTALGATFIERRETLGLFGYAATITKPDDAETRWAIDVFHSEINQDSIPAYLLDCSHRLLAWNSLVNKIFEAVSTLSDSVLMPRLIFDPSFGIAPAILNAEMFYSAQIRILHFEQQRCGDEAWFNTFVDQMREYRAFDQYWTKYNRLDRFQVPMRPVAQLTLATGHAVAQFRLISEPFAQDPRFRVIYYLPSESSTMRQCLEWQSQLSALSSNTGLGRHINAVRIG